MTYTDTTATQIPGTGNSIQHVDEAQLLGERCNRKLKNGPLHRDWQKSCLCWGILPLSFERTINKVILNYSL
jgi:hypothetical protein